MKEQGKVVTRQWRGQFRFGPKAVIPLFSLSVPFLLVGVALVAWGFGALPMEVKELRGQEWVLIVFSLPFFTGSAALFVAALRAKKSQTTRSTQGCSPEIDYPWSPQGIGDDNDHRFKRVVWRVLILVSVLAPFHVLPFTLLQGNRINQYLIFGLLVFFDLILFGELCQVVSFGLRRLMFGETRVHFHRFPFHLGETLGITFEGGNKLRNAELNVELRCIREEYEIDFAYDLNVTCYQPYRERHEYETDIVGHSEIVFTLPGDAPPTRLSSDPPTYWELVVKAKPAGSSIGYEGLFLMPIYEKV